MFGCLGCWTAGLVQFRHTRDACCRAGSLAKFIYSDSGGNANPWKSDAIDWGSVTIATSATMRQGTCSQEESRDMHVCDSRCGPAADALVCLRSLWLAHLTLQKLNVDLKSGSLVLPGIHPTHSHFPRSVLTLVSLASSDSVKTNPSTLYPDSTDGYRWVQKETDGFQSHIESLMEGLHMPPSSLTICLKSLNAHLEVVMLRYASIS